MAALVVAHDAVTGVGQQRGETIEGTGEVECAMHQQQRRRIDGAPFVDGELDAA